MKKLLSVLLSAVMLTLCSCGNGDNSDKNEKLNIEEVYESVKESFTEWYSQTYDDESSNDVSADDMLADITVTCGEDKIELSYNTNDDLEDIYNKLSSKEFTYDEFNAILTFMYRYECARTEMILINDSLGIDDSITDKINTECKEFFYSSGEFSEFENKEECKTSNGQSLTIEWEQSKSPYKFSIKYTVN